MLVAAWIWFGSSRYTLVDTLDLVLVDTLVLACANIRRNGLLVVELYRKIIRDRLRK